MATSLFKLVGSIFIDTEDADKSLQKTTDKADGFGSKFGSVAKTVGTAAAGAAAAAGTAAVAIATKSISAASDFEDSFAKVNTLLSDTTDLDDYKQSIIDLSNEMGVGTADISEAVYGAISAGVDQADAVSFVGEAMKLAEGGFTDASTAVDVMTTALNAYGLSSEEAGKVSDYLITTQNLGKTTVNELASSLGKIIPIASSSNVEMDDLSTNMAILTKNGIATAEATTYTKSMLNELGKDGSKVSKVLKDKTGKSFAELESEGYSLGDVIGIIGDSVDGDTTAFSNLWSSSEAGVAAITLLNAGTEEYNSTLEQMQNSTGATQSAFETMHDTMSTKIESFKNIFLNMAVSLGETLMPLVETVVDFIQNNMPTIQGLFETLTPIIQNAFEQLIGPIMELAETLLPVCVDFLNMMIPLISSIVSEIIPIAIKLLNTFLPIFMKICEKLLPPFLKIIEAILPIFTMILDVISPILDVLMELLDPFAEMLEMMAPMITVLLQLLKEILEPLMPVIIFIVQVISGALSIAIKGITLLIQGITTAIGWVVEKIVWLKENWTEIWNGIVNFFSGIVTSITTKVTNIKDKVVSVFTDMKTKIKGIFDGLKEVVKTPINWIIDKINGVFSSIGSIDIPSWVPVIGGQKFSLPQIPKLAEGGLVDGGQLFEARESGPELVGQYGSKSAVMNNDDIVAAVSRGVAEAVKSVFNNDDLANRIAEALQNSPIVAKIAEDDVFSSVRNSNKNYIQMTGRSAF